jgi:hypothetical protein
MSLRLLLWESRIIVKNLIQCCKILMVIVYTKLQVQNFYRDKDCRYALIIYCQITGKFPALEIKRRGEG